MIFEEDSRELNAEELKPLSSIVTPEELEANKESSFIETARAWASLEDPTTRLLIDTFGEKADTSIDPDFSVYDRLETERPDLLEYADRFVEVRNEDEYNKKLFNIDFELEQKEILSRASTPTMIAAGFASGMSDPLNLIPIVGGFKSAKTLANVGKGLLTGFGAGTVSAAARESILQSTSETRDMEQTAMNFLMESVAGSILGGGIGAFATPGAYAANKRLMQSVLEGKELAFKVNSDTGKVELSAGAMEVMKTDGSLAHINETLVKILSGPEALRPPDLRAALSKSSTVQMLGDVFYNSNLIKKYNAKGIGVGDRAELIITRANRRLANLNKDLDKMYTNYTGRSKLVSAFKPGEGKLSHRDFSKRVWDNLVDSDRIDDISEINQASKYIRNEMDILTKRLQKAGILDENIDVKFMANYMMRVYDHDKLLVPANRQAFTETLTTWMKDFDVNNVKREIPLDDDVAEKMAEDAVKNIMGETDQAIAMSSIAEGFISKGKFLKERTLMIPDSLIKDFLVDDGFRLFNTYSQKVNKLLAAQESLKKLGFESITDVKKAIDDDLNRALVGITDKKQIAKLTKSFEKDKSFVDDMYRSVLGQLRKPSTADRWVGRLLDYNYVRLLGGVTVSSLSEAMMIPFRSGFIETIKEGYIPFLRDFKTARLSRDQWDDVAGATELQMNNILRIMDGQEDPDIVLRDVSKYDMLSKSATQLMSKASLITDWTSWGSRMSTQVSSARIIKTIQKANKSQDEIEWLASIGIGKDSYDMIAEQANKYVQRQGGTLLTNPHLWDNEQALNILKAGVQVDAESAIIKPGIGSQPIFVQKYVMAKLLWQFKSFMSAATSRVTVSALQRRDATAISGIIALIGMGGIVELTQRAIRGKDLDMTPEQFMFAGISRCGVLGLIGTTSLDISRLMMDDKMKRYAGQNSVGTIMGPTAGTIKQAVDSFVGITDKGVSDKELKQALSLLPFSNLFYINTLVSRVFDEE